MTHAQRRSTLAALILSSAALVLAGRAASSARAASPAQEARAGLAFGDAFWKQWGDGKAELSGYDLTFPRYGELRKGMAVAVFVTETFSESLRVKSDPGRHPKSDEYPVLKLNLVQDFSTGIYDYNLLTSTFVALTPVNGRPAGSVTKVSFSSQEWCGNMYGQLLLDAGSARLASHSYFDGEADQIRTLPVPDDALSADALLLWARGLAAPAVAPGGRIEATLVKSLRTARLTHQPVETLRATLSRDGSTEKIAVPAGTIDVQRCRVEIAGGATWTILVEAAEPHRIVRWETSEGEKASLLGSGRLEYWKMHAEKDLSSLAVLGLKPRPPRTP
ncbi:MAG TPA: hypothetical protein VKE50_02175 [Thermoanaerobaculia bacterium]|nr:hypothetical protein [Thermoanaerobaculia bacterium]